MRPYTYGQYHMAKHDRTPSPKKMGPVLEKKIPLVFQRKIWQLIIELRSIKHGYHRSAVNGNMVNRRMENLTWRRRAARFSKYVRAEEYNTSFQQISSRFGN